MTFAESATYLGYAGGWAAVRRMPEGTAYRLFERMADRQWKARGTGVLRLEGNLARVLGPDRADELPEVSRAGMRSYMRYWCDAFRLPGWDRERLDRFDLRGSEQVLEVLGQGRGAVVALPHMGNWDHLGAYGSATIAPVHSVAERLRPERLFDAFIEFRTSLGMTIHGLGDPGVYDQLALTAAGGGLIALLADRDLSSRGIEVDFFGEPTRFPAGPAALAVDTGAALFPIGLFWNGRNAAQVCAEIAVPEHGDRAERIRVTTQLVADALAEQVRAHPEDWHMLQRLWLADLDPSRLADRDAGGS